MSRQAGAIRWTRGTSSSTPSCLSRFHDITFDLARESGFESVEDLLGVARHGAGENVYLIRFHYLPPGAWDVPRKQPRRGIEPE